MSANTVFKLIPATHVRSLDEGDLDTVLPEFGFSARVFWRALRDGWIGRANVGEDYIQRARVQGERDRQDRLASLVRQLVPFGANKADRWQAVLLKDGKTALTTLRGDRNAGVPTAAAPKTLGKRSAWFLHHMDQLKDAGTNARKDPQEVQKSLGALGLEFWVFLVNYNSKAPNHVYSEVSLPLVAESGRLTGWLKQIRMPPFDIRRLGEPDIQPDGSGTAGGGDAITVEVEVEPREP